MCLFYIWSELQDQHYTSKYRLEKENVNILQVYVIYSSLAWPGDKEPNKKRSGFTNIILLQWMIIWAFRNFHMYDVLPWHICSHQYKSELRVRRSIFLFSAKQISRSIQSKQNTQEKQSVITYRKSLFWSGKTSTIRKRLINQFKQKETQQTK